MRCCFCLVVPLLVFSQVPPGMDEWYMIDYCGEPGWDKFRETLERKNLPEIFHALQEPVLNPAIGFRCATAVAAGCELVAKLLEEENGKNSEIILRFRQISSIFLSFDFTMKGTEWIDSSVWNIRWAGSVESVLRSMQKVHRNSPERSLTMSEILKSQEIGKIPMKIGIVTVCDYDSTLTDLARLSRLNKETYANKHGYSFFYFDKAPTFPDWWASHANMYERPPAWSKIDAMLLVLSEQPNLDWLMWMDCDSFFMDMDVKIESVVAEAPNRSDSGKIEQLKRWTPTRKDPPIAEAIAEYNDLAQRLQPEPDSYEVIISEDGLMLNSGIFFVRASIFSFAFLQKVRQFTFNKSPATFHSWWEQTAMVLLFAETLWENGNPWPAFVKPYFQKQLNVYPPLIAGMLSTHVAYDPGDYIVSFSGCKIYTSQAVCNNMFADYFDQSLKQTA